MRIRAVAAPSNESNAVGSLELECSPTGLLIVYLGVGAYTSGYAPAAITQGTRLLIPWNGVEEVRATPEQILLVIDSRLTPHSRLCLTRFSDTSALPPQELTKRRHIIWLATAALMVASALSVGANWPRWSVGASQATALAVGAGAALMVLGLGLFFDHWASSSGTSSQQLRELFLAELKHYRPKPVLLGAAPRSRAADFEWTDLIRLVPRSTLAIIIVFSAMTLGAVLTSSWLIRGPQQERQVTSRGLTDQAATQNQPALHPMPDPPTEPADTGPQIAAPTPEAAPEPAPPEGDAGQACVCERADSALWRLQFPRLSTLLIDQRSRTHKDHQHLELELAVINNGSTTIDEVNLMVSFFEGEGNSKQPTKTRPLHYGAPLRPAQAIKWHVEARGTSFSVQNPIADVLPEDPKQLASADAFAKLISANHRPVRLHGAMMLAYLGDPRAKAGAARLREALRESEGPYLDRVLATQGDLITCDWQSSESGRVREVAACVFNVSGQPIDGVGLAVRALDRLFDYRNPIAPPPLIIAEHVERLPGSFGPGEGRRVVSKLDTDNPDGRTPETLELVADLYERL